MDQETKLYPSSFNPLFNKPIRPAPKEIAIIGAGTIGPDIGYYLKSAIPGIKLHLVDVVEEPLAKAKKRYSDYVQKAVDRRKMKEDTGKAILNNIIYTTDYKEIKNCDLVIEAATENILLKQKIFDTVESIVGEDTIITSNTSSIPADRLFRKMKRPERTTVTHFFSPAWRSLPVEVITWEGGSEEIIDYLNWFFAFTGKVPIMTDNAICFMLNRVFVNWCNEAAYLLDHASASQIDSVAEEFVAAGPFFVLNMTHGNPINIETSTLQMEEGAHYRPAPILGSVDRWLTHRPGTKLEVPEDIKNTIRERMLGILFSQSFDIIDRGIGTKEDLNIGCQLALGFKKGPLDIMRNCGEAEVERIMKKFEDARSGFPQAKQPFSIYQDFNRYLLVDEIEGVKIITIRRPQAMNAISDEINNEILKVLKENIDNPAVKGFIITGYGNAAFSAGADIGKFPATGANMFHEMICLARRMTVKEAHDIGMVTSISEDYSDMIQEAVKEVHKIAGNITRVPEGKVDIPEISIPDNPMAGNLALSKEAISIIVKTVKAGAAADTFAEALEIGYQGSAEIACTEAAKEGISAFLEKRKPEFKK